MKMEEKKMAKQLFCEKETYGILHCAMEVSNTLGSGFLEAVYQEAMEMELDSAGIAFEPKQRLNIVYKGRVLKKEYEADLVCYGNVIVELKALDKITGVEEAQLLNYLKATGVKVGLLINFGKPRLEWKRFVL